jgi:hypothetical protein
MKQLSISLLIGVCLWANGLCETIHIKDIDPMPGFESIGGPAFGEEVSSYSGKGLVQFVSQDKIIINSKMYLIDSSSQCIQQISTGQIKRACIVSYELNDLAQVNLLNLIVQLDDTGKIDRITYDGLIYNDHYRKIFLYVSFHDITGKDINRHEFDIGDFIGLTINENNEIKSLWQLDGHYLY